MSIEQHAEAAAEKIVPGRVWPEFGQVKAEIMPHIQAAIDETTATNEHAQVGALLAKCCDYRLGEYEQGWFAEITLRNSEAGNSDTFQPTQLAAIKAAVEAAEKGVRE